MIQSDLLKCPVCYLEFDRAHCIPKLLPACGHTVCSKCLDQILKTQPAKCPLDRNIIDPKLKVGASFTTNVVLTQLIEERPKMQYGICLTHQQPKNLFCMRDKIKICQSCVNGKDDASHKDHETKPLSEILEQTKSKTAQLKSKIISLDSDHQKVFNLLEEKKKDAFQLKKRKFDEIRNFIDKAEQEVWSEIGLVFGYKKTKTEDQFKKDQELIERIRVQMSTLDEASLDKAFFSVLDQDICQESQYSKQEEQDIKDLSKTIEDELEVVHGKINESLISAFRQFPPKIEFIKTQEGQILAYVSSLVGISRKGQLLVIEIIDPQQLAQNRFVDLKDLKEIKSVRLSFRLTKLTEEAISALCFIWKELKSLTNLSMNLSCLGNHKDYSMLFGHDFWATEKIESFTLDSFLVIETPENQPETKSLMGLLFKSLVRMTNLKCLCFSPPITKMQDETLIGFAHQVIPFLRTLEVFKLDLRYTESTDAALKEVWLKSKGVLQKIKAFSLKVDNYSKITTESLKPLMKDGLANFTCLEKFNLGYHALNVDEDDIHNFWIALGPLMKDIKSFSISFPYTCVTDRTVEGLAKKVLPFMPLLEKLKLKFTDCSDITDKSLKSLSRSLSKSKNLKTLKLRLRSNFITDDGVKIFAKNLLPNLSKLETLELILDENDFGDESTIELWKRLRPITQNLKGLIFKFKNTNTTDSSFQVFTNEILPNLSTINSLVLDLTEKKFAKISFEQFFFKLKVIVDHIVNLKIVLEGCEEITDEVLDKFLVEVLPFMTKLRKLNLNINMTKITWKSVENMCLQLGKLNDLDFIDIFYTFHEPLVSNDSLALLNAIYPTLSITDCSISIR